jgi:hypothetical protein
MRPPRVRVRLWGLLTAVAMTAPLLASARDRESAELAYWVFVLLLLIIVHVTDGRG